MLYITLPVRTALSWDHACLPPTSHDLLPHPATPGQATPPHRVHLGVHHQVGALVLGRGLQVDDGQGTTCLEGAQRQVGRGHNLEAGAQAQRQALKGASREGSRSNGRGCDLQAHAVCPWLAPQRYSSHMWPLAQPSLTAFTEGLPILVAQATAASAATQLLPPGLPLLARIHMAQCRALYPAPYPPFAPSLPTTLAPPALHARPALTTAEACRSLAASSVGGSASSQSRM